MADLNTELKELASLLATANHQLEALDPSASQTHMQRINQVIAAMEQARLDAKAEQLALASRDQKTRTAADGYFAAIETARTAMTTGGTLAPAVLSSQRNQLKTALRLGTLADLDTLLAEVASYDLDGRDAVAAANATLQNAATERHAAETALQASRAQLDRVERAITSLAAGALDYTDTAHRQLAATDGARDAGRLHEAVVHLFDLTATREHLNAAPTFDPDDPGFDSNNNDATALTAALTAAWDAAKSDYEAKLTTLLDKQSHHFEAQLALAAAEAEAATRGERRLLDATAQVAAKQATL